jgi:hypothetical protein
MIARTAGRNGFGGARAALFACLLAGAASAALPWASASAQGRAGGVDARAPRALTIDGPPVSATLSASAPEVDERHADSYRLRLRSGESVQVDMKSGAFDSYLDVLAPGNSDEPLKSNDDIGGGVRDARLRFTASAAGDYVVRAQGYSGGTGAYTLSVARREVAPPPGIVAIANGADVSGKFDDRSALDDDDHPYAFYTFDGKAGERVRIDMVSTPLDSALDLTLEGKAEGEGFSLSNDDGGDGLNARIFAILPESGRYRVKARNINQETGSYALALQIYPPAGPPAPPRQLRREAPTIGRLSFDDSDLQMAYDDSGNASYFYRLYALPMQAGETLTIELKAEGFDPVLDAGVMSPLGFAVARTNDDADGTNSRLTLTPTEAGTIYLRARSLNAESMGEYTLNVTEGAPAPPAGD